MKKFIVVFIVLLLTCSVTTATEKILNFHSKIQILDNADIVVEENIKVNVENRYIRHGIYRDSPTVYLGAYLSHQKFDVIIVNVKLDGKAVNYSTERLLNGIRVKIGSKNYYVSRGVHQYTIEYVAKQQVKVFENSEGLYWNVTGNGWAFPIRRASVDIYLPQEKNLKVLTSKAWTGSQGSTETNFSSKINNSIIHFEMTKPLSSHQGFTIQTTWSKGAITQIENKTWLFIKNNFFWLLSIFMLLLYPLYFYFSWRKVGIDPPKEPVYPLFNPPNNMSPAAIRYVRKKYQDSKGFSIAIMNLAVKNFITIEQVSKKKYILNKQQNNNDLSVLSRGERSLFKSLFSSQDTIEIGTKYNPKIKTAMNFLELMLKTEYQDAFYKDNSKVWLLGVLISLLVLLFTWGHFFNFSTYAMPYLLIPGAGIIASAGVMGFAKKTIHKILAAVLPSIVVFIALLSQPNKVYMAYLVVILFIFILNALFAYLIEAPTVFGQKLLGKIEGFRLYLNTAEQDRLDLMHPPEMTPKLFEKYLPYAMALGVENRWSEQFNNAMKIQGKDVSNYQPNWYIGNNYSRFNFASTASSIGAGLASSAIAAATPPAPSGGSGGFGGGGFSGGGGGGGGGGGW